MNIETEPTFRWLAPDAIVPNTWNVNVMTDEQYAKAVASIAEFGFVDPITVRPRDTRFEIIDGEHRWKAAVDHELGRIPAFDVGMIDDTTAMRLSLVLNELHGQADPPRLAALLRDLQSKVGLDALLATLPYSREALERLVPPSLDFTMPTLGELPPGNRPSMWVERVFRLPPDVAAIVDAAIDRHRAEGGTHDWQALGAMAEVYLDQ